MLVSQLEDRVSVFIVDQGDDNGAGKKVVAPHFTILPDFQFVLLTIFGSAENEWFLGLR